MFDFFVRFFSKPREDVRLEVPGVDIVFNHRLRLALLYDADPETPDGAYDELEAHLKRYKYALIIVVAPRGGGLLPGQSSGKD